MDAGELAARHRQIARQRSLRRPARSRRNRARSSSTGTLTPTLQLVRNITPSSCMQGEPAIEEPLFQLELGDAVAQQPADAIGALENGDRVAGAVQLLGGREAGRPGADDGDALAGAHLGRLGGDPAFVERALDDRHFDRP